jgi:cardiolipin synthase
MGLRSFSALRMTSAAHSATVRTMWVPLVTVAMVLWVAGVAVVILLERRSAAATLAWLFALVFLPIVGLLVYRLIGPLRLERKKVRRSASRRVVAEALAALAALDDDTIEHQQLARVGIALGEASPLRAGEVDIYLDGDAAYAAILAEVAAARQHVHLEYYIWEPDQIGTKLRDLLIERAGAGVKVRLVMDASGSHHVKKQFLAPLVAAGVEFAWFNPISWPRLRPRRPDFRTHRKIVVVDGKVGFTGGMNITDAHAAGLSKDYWRDTHMRFTGAAVWPLQRLFMEDWNFAADAMCPITDETFPPAASAGEHLLQVIGSGPDSDRFAIHKMLFTAINQSTERLWITTPYFVPDEPLVTALQSAALRDVDVRLLLPKKSDSLLIDLAARSYLSDLLAAGVRIYEYEARFIHAKTMVCDDDVAIVGTANLDNRSFRLNFEIAVLIFGEIGCIKLAAAYEDDLRVSRELTRADFEGESFARRLGQASARLMSPLL